MLNRLHKILLDFIFPRECLACGAQNPEGDFNYLCKHCAEKIFYLNGGVCNKCGEVVAINSTLRINECANCIDNEPHFEKILSIALFGEGTRELLHALKYEKGFYVIKDLMKILENFEPSKNYLKDAILVPVPLHKKRIKKRKFNQSLLLAKAIVKIFPENNLKVAEILRRSKDTQSQTTLGKPERRRNVENAFKILETNYDIPKSSKIILLDDVATTGATLSECAKVLKKSGFKNVYAFALFKRL